MPRKKTPQSQHNAAAQHERFVETARALGCDEDKERFEEKLRRIAKAKPSKPKEAK
jgi:hypothetical protein